MGKKNRNQAYRLFRMGKIKLKMFNFDIKKN